MLQCGPVVEQVGRFMGESVARHSGEIGGLGCGETCRMGAQNIGVGVCGFGVSSGTKKRFCSPGEKPGRELGWRKVTTCRAQHRRCRGCARRVSKLAGTASPHRAWRVCRLGCSFARARRTLTRLFRLLDLDTSRHPIVCSRLKSVRKSQQEQILWTPVSDRVRCRRSAAMQSFLAPGLRLLPSYP